MRFRIIKEDFAFYTLQVWTGENRWQDIGPAFTTRWGAKRWARHLSSSPPARVVSEFEI